jgi:hypothetical protein
MEGNGNGFWTTGSKLLRNGQCLRSILISYWSQFHAHFVMKLPRFLVRTCFAFLVCAPWLGLGFISPSPPVDLSDQLPCSPLCHPITSSWQHVFFLTFMTSYNTTECHNPVDHDFNTRCHENFMSTISIRIRWWGFLYPSTQRHNRTLILLLILLYCYMFRSYDHLQARKYIIS